jgi:hypothetical protein
VRLAQSEYPSLTALVVIGFAGVPLGVLDFEELIISRHRT